MLVSLRVCKRCNRELPLTEFYNPPSGTRYKCKKCEYEIHVLYRKNHPGWMTEREREYVRKNPRRRWATACLSGHRRNGYAIEMTCQELYQIALKADSCFICGVELDWRLGNKGGMNRLSPTLDRLENENVIRANNIVILCYKCNATKQDRTFKEFLHYCEEVCKKFHSHFEYPQFEHL